MNKTIHVKDLVLWEETTNYAASEGISHSKLIEIALRQYMWRVQARRNNHGQAQAHTTSSSASA